MTLELEPAADTRANARPFASFQMRAEVRLFQTNQALACREDPEMFFNPRTKHRAIKRCNECPFRGRCGYNAVATGATHGIWGGVMLPGCFPQELKPIYARLAEQFEQRRQAELGDLQVAPLPDLVVDDEDDESLVFHAGAA
ncbi:WhiB family transcriptional regulator [Mycobacterium avium]|uniref:WhiB family transcriptional regulator n=1 Tax=Mycobacterium avium TaxID=1764 RepID=UPI0007A01CAC|nr:WhiB family transcriptional regulator [Mycobacterium avium]MBZ4522160.1 WhiB family transcriptional regulator [Mycobacterium avium subsp. hominissuis]MBZ4532371.1 WhiB family transcriptional regulator [Mycobacterium avium subsp. hominissuis]MBZ4612415.1 WhiB family transcriptional regulator [Mycobacterium avium subsp. hominissuis]